MRKNRVCIVELSLYRKEIPLTPKLTHTCQYDKNEEECKETFNMKLALQLTYVPLLSTVGSGSGRYASEKAKELHLWTTSRGDSDAKTVVVEAEKLQSGSHVVYSFQLPNSHTAAVYDGIGINAYCITRNRHRVACLSTVGSTMLTYMQLINGVRSAANEKQMAVWTLDLIDPTENDVVKGSISLTMSRRMVIQLAPKLSSYTFIQSRKGSILSMSRSDAQAVMSEFCMETIEEIESKFKPTEPAFITRPIRCPWYKVLLLLPGSAYAAVRPKKPFSPVVYERLLDTALARLRLTRKMALDALNSHEKFVKNYRTFSLIVAHTFCALAWALPYISDFVNLNRDDRPYRRSLVDDRSNENFKNTLLTLCGDCEDLAWIVYLLIAVFLESDYSKTAFSPLLQRLRELLKRHYMHELSQCAVSVANGMDIRHGDGIDLEDITCHTFANLLPISFVTTALKRGELFMTEQQRKGLLLPLQQKLSSIEQPKELLPIGCEGTAPLPVLHTRKSGEENKELILHNRALANLLERLCSPLRLVACRMECDPRKDVNPSDAHDISDFYKSNVTCYTTYMENLLGYPCLDYCFLKREAPLEATYGITAYDLFTQAASVELVPYNDYSQHKKKAVTLSDIQTVLSLLEPVPDLFVVNTNQSELCNQLQTLADTTLHSLHCSDSSRKEKARVSYYLRSDQVSEEFLQSLADVCQQHDLCVDYRVTPLLATSLHPNNHIVSLDVDIIQYVTA